MNANDQRKISMISPGISTASHRTYWDKSASISSLQEDQVSRVVSTTDSVTTQDVAMSSGMASARTEATVHKAETVVSPIPIVFCLLSLIKPVRNNAVDDFDIPTQRTYRRSLAKSACWTVSWLVCWFPYINRWAVPVLNVLDRFWGLDQSHIEPQPDRLWCTERLPRPIQTASALQGTQDLMIRSTYKPSHKYDVKVRALLFPLCPSPHARKK